MKLKLFFVNRRFFSIFLFFVLLAGAFAKAKIPELVNPVTDEAEIISPKVEASLNDYLFAVKNQTGIQIAVLTVTSLHGESIENFSIRACEKWKLGKKGDDKGILLTVALAEHKIRIDTGYGIEGVLTDLHCSKIIREIISPQFKQNSFSKGIFNGVLKISEIALDGKEIDFNWEDAGKNAEKEEQPLGSAFLVPLSWLVVFAVIYFLRKGRLPFFIFFPFFHSGGSHRNSGSSGGFSHHDHYSGGGGSFGGGGASGDW